MRVYILLIGMGLGFGAITYPTFAQSNGQERMLEDALANLRNSDTEWRREHKNYRTKRGSKSMSAEEAEEYAEFVAGLHRQKLEDCEAVRKIGGASALKGFDCIKFDNSGQRSTIVVVPKSDDAKTEGEKIDALEAKLKRLEADLDEELLRKQQIYRRKARNQRANSGNGSWSAPDGSGAGGSQSANSQRGRQESVAGASVNEAARAAGPRQKDTTGQGQSARNYEPGAGSGSKIIKSSPPVSTGAAEDGSDDDVVMRQVREAAERETDPVLQNKLWDEYRKLKAARK